MSMLKKNPIKVGIAATALILAAFFVVLLTGNRHTAPKRIAYYVVQESGELIVDAMAPSPIIDASRRTAMRAHVFTCGDCDRPNERFVGYVEKHSPEAIAQMNLPEPNNTTLRQGHMVSRAEQPWNWTPYDSQDGQALITSVRSQCADVKSCEP